MTPVAPLAGLTRSWCDYDMRTHLGHSGSDLKRCLLVSSRFLFGLSVKEKKGDIRLIQADKQG